MGSLSIHELWLASPSQEILLASPAIARLSGTYLASIGDMAGLTYPGQPIKFLLGIHKRHD